MYERITQENFMMFAIKHYENPHGDGEKEFHDDLKRFKYIKRLLKKYNTLWYFERTITSNHIIILRNLFGK